MKRLLCKGSILIPLAAVFALFIDPLSLYIGQMNLYLSYGILQFAFMTFSVIWLCCSPLRKGCCNGGWSEVLFNLVPIEVLLVLIFAQWHFMAAAFILAFILCLEIGFTISLKREARKRRYSRKIYRRYQYTLRRFCVLAMSVVCAIPCCMAVVIYECKSPTYVAEQKIWESISASEDVTDEVEASDPYEENLKLLRCFRKEVWEEYSIQEKITIMQELVNFESEQLGIPAIQVTAKKLNTYILGEYDRESNEMWIDVQHLEESSVDDCIATICHETYHSFQLYLIQNIDWESEAAQSAYFDELRSWKENAFNYMHADLYGYDAYQTQPLEDSAKSYAEEEVVHILSYIQ